MIEDAAFVEYESEGGCAFDRTESLLSAIFYATALGASQGDAKALTAIYENAGATDAVRPRKITQAILDARADANRRKLQAELEEMIRLEEKQTRRQGKN